MKQSLKQASDLVALYLLPIAEAGELVNLQDFFMHFEVAVDDLYNDGLLAEEHYYEMDYEAALAGLSRLGYEIV